MFAVPLAVFVILLVNQAVTPMSIDEMIAGSFESVDEFDQLADISGSVIRQELDMLLTRKQAIALGLLQSTEESKGDPRLTRKRRKAIRSSSYRWTNKVVPYSIASNVFSRSERYQIDKAIEEWEKYSCIKFRQANRNDNNKIHFDNGKGCYSYVGMTQTGSQKIGLAPGCRFKGVIIHEVGHAIGFHHEQNRPDRDNYVRIMKDNIPKTLYYNFQKYPTSAVDTMGVPYDVTSIMHYGKTAFTKNGRMTIRTVDPKDQNKIGNRKGLSYLDIMLANKMYKCNEHCNQGIRCPNGAFLGKDCKCWCPGDPVRDCASTGTLPITTTEKPTTEVCGDKNKNCPAWAGAGYCDRNSYVKTYCKESCNFCSGQETKPDCRDLKTHCDFWGRQGYCKGDFEIFMSENCPKTCKICGSLKGDPQEEMGQTTKNPDEGNNGKVVKSSFLLMCLLCLTPLFL